MPNPRYAITTNDGANILVTATGHNGIESITFETGFSNYTWLNKVVAVGKIAVTSDGKAITIDVWQASA